MEDDVRADFVHSSLHLFAVGQVCPKKIDSRKELLNPPQPGRRPYHSVDFGVPAEEFPDQIGPNETCPPSHQNPLTS
jgi:hypothetical protein